jgi:signal transduction histidine kinase
VTVEVARDQSAVVLRVSDTGIGMNEDVVPHVTDRFYRASTVDTMSVQGSGLGLALVQQIVQWHGGTLAIDSAPGEGTTVTVRLPAAAEKNEKATEGAVSSASA